MTSRILPPEEYPRLVGTLLDGVWQTMNPAQSEILVVEDAHGQIRGSVALLSVLHAECLSGDDSLAVRRALWTMLRRRVSAAGGRAVWGAAVDRRMGRLLERHAAEVPGRHYVVSVGSHTCRQ